MKRLIVIVAVALASVMAMGAQCEGKTQKGERCKREAAEDSKFCIGHADQAKKEKKAESKAKPDAKAKAEGEIKHESDVACWAVTEAGTRCKHKRDGESDYCKQHAASVKPSEPVTQCRAMTYEGTQCTRKPEEGKRYCKQHMGK